MQIKIIIMILKTYYRESMVYALAQHRYVDSKNKVYSTEKQTERNQS